MGYPCDCPKLEHEGSGDEGYCCATAAYGPRAPSRSERTEDDGGWCPNTTHGTCEETNRATGERCVLPAGHPGRSHSPGEHGTGEWEYDAPTPAPGSASPPAPRRARSNSASLHAVSVPVGGGGGDAKH